MTKQPTNHGKQWTQQQVGDLKRLAAQNTPTRVIGLKLGRTEDSVRAQASKEQVSLRPWNQPPYGTSKR